MLRAKPLLPWNLSFTAQEIGSLQCILSMGLVCSSMAARSIAWKCMHDVQTVVKQTVGNDVLSVELSRSLGHYHSAGLHDAGHD